MPQFLTDPPMTSRSPSSFTGVVRTATPPQGRGGTTMIDAHTLNFVIFSSGASSARRWARR